MKIKLCDIFVPQSGKRLYTIQELSKLEIGGGFVTDLSTRLGLDYLEDHKQNGNLCFVHSREVRTELRTVCSKTDIIHLIKAVLQESHFDMESDEILFPINATKFWKLAKTGSRFREKTEN